MNTTRKNGPAAFIVIGLVICLGLVVGLVYDKAVADEEVEADVFVVCEGSETDTCDGWSVIETPKMGGSKYRKGWLNRMGKHEYTKAAKVRIINALMPAWEKHSAKMATEGLAREAIAAMPNTRAEVWANYKANDNCGFRPVQGSGTWSEWTCDSPWPKVEVMMTEKEIKGVICTAVSGASLPAVFAAGAGTGFGLLGVGAAWAACMWGQDIVNLGR